MRYLGTNKAAVATTAGVGFGSKSDTYTKTESKARGVARIPAKILAPRLILILSTIALVIFGLVMVYSASFVEAYTNPEIADSAHIFRRQAILVGVGIVLMIAAALLDYRVWNTRLTWIIWLVVVALLVATMFVGTEINGGTRWVSVFGQQFQPSEFAKVAMILLASTLVIQLRESLNITPTIITIGVAVGLPVALIMLQPDLGTTLIIFAGIIAVAWFGELSMKPIAIAGMLVLFIAASAVMLAGFRMDRIDAWLDPFSYASSSGYQIVNSFYAFADGGIAGVGLGMSHQKYLYLPEPYNDLIFPIIGEEFGMIGCIVVILLFLAFLYASFRIARNAPDIYGRMVAGAAATMIGFQAFLNMLCMVGLFPMTGKPLPFFSAGGTSMIVTLILTGLILNVSLRSKVIDEAKERREELMIFEGGQNNIPGKLSALSPAFVSTPGKKKNVKAAAKTSTGALRLRNTQTKEPVSSSKLNSNNALRLRSTSANESRTAPRTKNGSVGQKSRTGKISAHESTWSQIGTNERRQTPKTPTRLATNPARNSSAARSADLTRALSPARNKKKSGAPSSSRKKPL